MSLRYGADLGRSRLVFIFLSDHKAHRGVFQVLDRELQPDPQPHPRDPPSAVHSSESPLPHLSAESAHPQTQLPTRLLPHQQPPSRNVSHPTSVNKLR